VECLARQARKAFEQGGGLLQSLVGDHGRLPRCSTLKYTRPLY
jgi:hypothetical protein